MSVLAQNFLEQQRERFARAAYEAADELHGACDCERVEFGPAARERIAALRLALATALDALDTTGAELERARAAREEAAR